MKNKPKTNFDLITNSIPKVGKRYKEVDALGTFYV